MRAASAAATPWESLLVALAVVSRLALPLRQGLLMLAVRVRCLPLGPQARCHSELVGAQRL